MAGGGTQADRWTQLAADAVSCHLARQLTQPRQLGGTAEQCATVQEYTM